MLKKCEILHKRIEGIDVTVQPFGFKDSQVIPNSVNVKEKTPGLVNCFVSKIEGTTLIRTGSIDTQEKAEQFHMLLHHICPNKPIRVSSNQLHSAEFEWGAVEIQHEYLMKSMDSTVHMSTPLDPIYSETAQRDKIAREERDLVRLPKLLNAEAWIDYCAFFNVDVEKAAYSLPFSAVDAYTLERYLKDFTHEVYSTLLPRMRKRVSEIQKKIGTQETRAEISYRTLVVLQKELILAREDLLRQVEAHYNVLLNMIKYIKVIEEVHPELIDLKIKAIILSQLLSEEDCCKQQMLIQLFNDQYGLISAINSEEGFERASLAFSIRLTIIQMRQCYPLSDLLDVIADWEVLNRNLNRGVKDRKGMNIIIKLRELFLQNLQTFSIPITSISSKEPFQWHEGLYLNKTFLNFLPSHAEVYNEIDELELLPLVEYDSNTGKPTELTKTGHRIMSKIKGVT